MKKPKLQNLRLRESMLSVADVNDEPYLPSLIPIRDSSDD